MKVNTACIEFKQLQQRLGYRVVSWPGSLSCDRGAGGAQAGGKLSVVDRGWYPNPDGTGGQRLWDGERWTDDVHRDERQASEPPHESIAPSSVVTQPQTQQPWRPDGGPTVIYHQQVPPKRNKVARGCMGGFVGVVLGLVGIVMLIIIIIVVAIGNAAHNASPPGQGSVTHPAAADVTATCDPRPAGDPFMSATATIVNHTSQPSNYLFTIEFDDAAGTRLQSGAGIENDVQPGQTAHSQVTTTAPGSGTVTTCKAVGVDRLASH